MSLQYAKITQSRNYLANNNNMLFNYCNIYKLQVNIAFRVAHLDKATIHIITRNIHY